MCVDIVSSESDSDVLDCEKNVSQWNHHEVVRLEGDFVCGNVLGTSLKIHLQSLSQRKIQPMMASCSGTYKHNSDGSWEVKGELVFTNPEQQAKRTEKENTSENSAGQGTTAKDNDPPDSRDRAHD